MIYIRYTISKISFSYIMYISIILCRNYLQIVRSNYVYFGQINESVCLSVCHRLQQWRYAVQGKPAAVAFKTCSYVYISTKVMYRRHS